MTRSIDECLDRIDYLIYSKNICKKTIISKQSTHLLISHLNNKKKESLKELLNKILTKAEQENNLLTHKGLQNILIKKYPEILYNFMKTEKAKRYIQ